MPLMEAHIPRSLQVVTQVQDLSIVTFDAWLAYGSFRLLFSVVTVARNWGAMR